MTVEAEIAPPTPAPPPAPVPTVTVEAEVAPPTPAPPPAPVPTVTADTAPPPARAATVLPPPAPTAEPVSVQDLPPPAAIPPPPADRTGGATTSVDRQVARLVENTDVPTGSPTREAAPTEVVRLQIVVRAKTDSWIQVRDDIGNRLLMTRLMRAGDEYVVPDRPGLKLLTGNAGALEVLVDGKVAPSLGENGEVRRDVALEPDLLLAGTAAAR